MTEINKNKFTLESLIEFGDKIKQEQKIQRQNQKFRNEPAYYAESLDTDYDSEVSLSFERHVMLALIQNLQELNGTLKSIDRKLEKNK